MMYRNKQNVAAIFNTASALTTQSNTQLQSQDFATHVCYASRHKTLEHTGIHSTRPDIKGRKQENNEAK